MDILQYFARDYHGPPFVLFGTVHLLTLAVVAVFILGLTRFKGAPEQTLQRVRWTLASVLWLNEIAWHLWNMAVGTWTAQTMLPLHLCSVLVWLTGFALVTRNALLYDFVYFLGIGAAVQALLTPDAGPYGFPHFRYIQPIISHGVLVSAGVYLTVVEGLRPTWTSMARVFVITNVYMFVIYFVNLALGSNYMMVNAKPGVTSLFDLLPAWPWYILCAEAIAVAIFVLLYLPFAIQDWQVKQAVD